MIEYPQRESGIAPSLPSVTNANLSQSSAPLPEISPELKALVPRDVAMKYSFYPLGHSTTRGGSLLTITVMSCEKLSAEQQKAAAAEVKSQLRMACDVRIMPVSALLERSKLIAGLERAYGSGAVATHHESAGWNLDREQHKTIAAKFLARAIRSGASDLIFQPGPRGVLVRGKIDGGWKNLCPPLTMEGKTIEQAMQTISAVFAARVDGLPIDRFRRDPLDGRGTVFFEGREFDLRVSSIPLTNLNSSELCIRLLDKHADWSLDKVSLFASNKQLIKQALAHPYGLIIVTGPTGSGKSSLMFSMLTEFDAEDKNIITLENPVEYEVKGATQISIGPNLSFSDGLRQILRQAPDVIMVGEVRDRETAEIAAGAAETGHLVLTTLHTNDALSTITRLRDLGLPSYLISSALDLVVSQRLVKRIVPEAWEMVEMPAKELSQFGFVVPSSQDTVKVPRQKKDLPPGTPLYKGRIALQEVLLIDQSLRDAIHEGSPQAKLRQLARGNGMVTLIEDGLSKATMGLTSLEEVKLAAKA